jgi:uncharacterized protein YbjT (DUF2867 family)
MKIVVIGGTGLLGSRVAQFLAEQGHQVVVAARETGVNSYTGDGLAEALDGASVLIDASNSSYTDEAGARDFFEVSTLNLLTYGAAAGVANHISLSVVGTDRLAASEGGYFQAKAEQERLIRESGRPFTLAHGTQFYEFIGSIADSATDGRHVRLADVLMQPISANDLAAAVAAEATVIPRNSIVEFAGPERFRLAELVARHLKMQNDPREVMPDPLARYFGARLDDNEFLPSDRAILSGERFDDWLIKS